MKTKLFILLTAAMLLLSVNVSAQNKKAKATKAVKTEKTVKKVTTKKAPAETPLKGDVNSDGVVDVADIAAVIGIMKNGGGVTSGYFYLGTTKPTEENYKTLPGVVTSYTSIDEAVETPVSVAAGETLYMLCPAVWMEEKTVRLEDNEKVFGFLDEKDATTISGYLIYKTQVYNAPNDVFIQAVCLLDNNYFLGASPVTKVTFTTNDLYEYKTTKPSSITVKISDGENYLAVWIYPASWGEPKAMMNLGDNDKSAWIFNSDPYCDLTAPEGYIIAYANLYSNATFELIW